MGKFIFCLLFLTSVYSATAELKTLQEDKEYQAINAKYCKLDVVHACYAQKCLNEDDEQACKQMEAKVTENLQETKQRMQKRVMSDSKMQKIRAKCEKASDKKCPEYFEAMMKAAKESSKEEVKVFAKGCDNGRKDSCYYRDVMSYGLKRLP